MTETSAPAAASWCCFRAATARVRAWRFALDQAQDDQKLKPITRQLDPEPILTPELIRLPSGCMTAFSAPSTMRCTRSCRPVSGIGSARSLRCVGAGYRCGAHAVRALQAAGGWRWRPCLRMALPAGDIADGVRRQRSREHAALARGAKAPDRRGCKRRATSS